MPTWRRRPSVRAKSQECCRRASQEGKRSGDASRRAGEGQNTSRRFKSEVDPSSTSKRESSAVPPTFDPTSERSKAYATRPIMRARAVPWLERGEGGEDDAERRRVGLVAPPDEGEAARQRRAERDGGQRAGLHLGGDGHGGGEREPEARAHQLLDRLGIAELHRHARGGARLAEPLVDHLPDRAAALVEDQRMARQLGGRERCAAAPRPAGGRDGDEGIDAQRLDGRAPSLTPAGSRWRGRAGWRRPPRPPPASCR